MRSLTRWFLGLWKQAQRWWDCITPDGHVELELIDASGNVAKTLRGRNVVTAWQSVGGVAPTSGRDLMRRLLVPPALPGSLNSVADAFVGQVELGSGPTAETAGDTGLAVPLSPSSRKALSTVEFDPTNTYVTFIFDYGTSEANASISEAILLSGPTRNDVLSRKTFGAFSKTADFTLRLRWSYRF